MRYLSWPPTNPVSPSTLVIDRVPSYPENPLETQFAGIYGHNSELMSANFIGDTNRFVAFDSPFKGQQRTFVVDLETKELRWLNFLKKQSLAEQQQGYYDMLRLYKDTLIIKYSSYTQPTQVYMVRFTNV